jgi:carbon storage regulator
MGGLVLSRRLNEVILIGDTIKIEVIEIRGNHVRLHVTAPKEVAVHRKEVADAIAREKQDRPT